MSIATGRGGTDYQALQLMTSLERVLLERDRIRAINDAKRQLIQGIDLDLISGSRSSLGRASSTRRVSLRLIHLGGRGVVQTPRLHNIGMTAKRVRRDRLRSEMSLAPPCAALLAPRGSAREASLVAVWASVSKLLRRPRVSRVLGDGTEQIRNVAAVRATPSTESRLKLSTIFLAAA